MNLHMLLLLYLTLISCANSENIDTSVEDEKINNSNGKSVKIKLTYTYFNARKLIPILLLILSRPAVLEFDSGWIFTEQKAWKSMELW